MMETSANATADPDDVLGSFTASLDRLEVGHSRTDTAGFAEALGAVLEKPAVGGALPFEGISLDGTPASRDPTPAEVAAARTGVTAARLGVANYGSVAVSHAHAPGDLASLFPELHVAVLAASDIVPDMEGAFAALGSIFRNEKTSLVLATGPSATADMGALVKGAHGPKRVHVVILEDR
jgi:L-lactate dehydrogenase complex protein LldG